MAFGADFDLGGVETLAGDVDESVGFETSLEFGSVSFGQRGLHLVDARPQSGAQRSEVRDHVPAQETGERVESFERLHVELAHDLGVDLWGEFDLPVQQQRPRQRLTHLRLGIGASGAPQRDESTGGVHLLRQRRIVTSARFGPVGQVHRTRTGQRGVDLVGQERAEGRQELRDRHEAFVQGRMGVGVAGLPEPRPAATHVPVGEVIDESGKTGGAAERVESLEGIGDRGDGVVEFGEDPAVEHMGRNRRISARRPPVEVGIGGEERMHVPEGEQRLPGGLTDAVLEHPPWSPGLARGEEVPPERIGAERVEDVERGDDVAARLGHLLTVLVDDQGETDDVAIGRGSEDEGVHREE